MKKELCVYIHIPFCYKKCPYCAFVSYEKRFNLVDDYTEALAKQIRSFDGKNYTVKTLYFGGGTPTVLKVKHIEKILKALESTFDLDTEELTIETIPNNVKPNYIRTLKFLGFNRLSIGIQSFRDKKLKALGRIHNSKESIQAVETAFKYGFDNISIDLIYGIEDNLDTFGHELELAMNLPIKHISTYMLTIEKGTHFFNFFKSGKLNLPNDELVSDLYIMLCEKLNKGGFEQYEISNFAKKGFYSKHNMSYWTNKEYIGFGVSAASFIDRKRLKVIEDLEKYIKNPITSVFIEEILNKDELIKEMFILGLRLKKGVDIREFKRLFGIDLIEYFDKKIKKFLNLGFIRIENNRIFLNGCRAFVVSNTIFSELI